MNSWGPLAYRKLVIQQKIPTGGIEVWQSLLISCGTPQPFPPESPPAPSCSPLKWGWGGGVIQWDSSSPSPLQRRLHFECELCFGDAAPSRNSMVSNYCVYYKKDICLEKSRDFMKYFEIVKYTVQLSHLWIKAGKPWIDRLVLMVARQRINAPCIVMQVKSTCNWKHFQPSCYLQSMKLNRFVWNLEAHNTRKSKE